MGPPRRPGQTGTPAQGLSETRVQVTMEAEMEPGGRPWPATLFFSSKLGRGPKVNPLLARAGSKEAALMPGRG